MTGPGRDREVFRVWMERECPELSPGQREAVLAFGDLLEEAAARKNLLSTGDRAHLYTRHLREALDPALLGAIPESGLILDVGTGAGLPGVVLALARPRPRFLLVEPRARRVAFLERAVLRLGLGGRVEVFAGTLEELARRSTEPAARAAVARALRWTPEMTRSLESLLVGEGVLIRLGSPEEASPEVRVVALRGGERAVQIWPRSRWADLPQAT
jgi:16S rRNA (guanine527-N7)-methyltransferase